MNDALNYLIERGMSSNEIRCGIDKKITLEKDSEDTMKKMEKQARTERW